MIEAERNVVAKQEPRTVKPEKRKAGGGAAMLRKAASRVLRDQGREIARALGERSKEGSIPSIKLLYDLTRGHQEPANAEEAGQFRSLADELAAEPQWPGKLSEEDAETASRSREPEG